MKAGLATSMVLHAAVLAYGLVTLSAPSPFEVADVESLPVDIVPVEELTQILEGDKTAAVSETPAPVPTQKPQTVPDAQEIGEQDQDLSTPPTPEAKPREVKAAAEPPPPPPPPPEPAPEPVLEPAPAPEPQPVVEKTPEPTPAPVVTPEPAPAATVAEAAPEAEAVKLPDSAPAPQARPKPPEPQTAEAPAKKPEPEKKAAETPKPEKRELAEKPDAEEVPLEDQVAMLLNKEKASGGGAKRSTQTASFGGEKKTAGSQKLSQGEMDALRSQLGGCWNLPAGAEGADGLRVSVRFEVDASGKVDGQPEVTTSSGNRTFDESALRAIRKCNQQGLILPKDKADVWSEIVVNFDPSDMIF